MAAVLWQLETSPPWDDNPFLWNLSICSVCAKIRFSFTQNWYKPAATFVYDGPECESPTKRQLRHAYLAVRQRKSDSLIRTYGVYCPRNGETVWTVSAGIVYAVMLGRFNHKNRFPVQLNTFHLFSWNTCSLLSILSTLVNELKETEIQYTILTTQYGHYVFKV